MPRDLEDLSHWLCWNKEGMHQWLCTWSWGSLLSQATEAQPLASYWKSVEPPLPLLLSLQHFQRTRPINFLDFQLPNQPSLTRGHLEQINKVTHSPEGLLHSFKNLSTASLEAAVYSDSVHLIAVSLL